MIYRQEGPETLPLQDLDLFTRLTQYFDTFEHHLRAGHGWFIFNASGARAMRITTFIASRIQEFGPWISTHLIPWREFSLNAYMVQIELQSIAEPEMLEGKAKTEFVIASRVSRDQMVKMVASDLLIISGLRPTHPHELEFLDETIARRYQQQLSTILISPLLPQDLATTFAELMPGAPIWDRLFSRTYQRNFIAL
ncbi:MAG TPA: hypothetical protein VHV31_17330 [Nitrolancea sp.]|nr:hypothetical protein [Nitrolancea sp.]